MLPPAEQTNRSGGGFNRLNVHDASPLVGFESLFGGSIPGHRLDALPAPHVRSFPKPRIVANWASCFAIRTASQEQSLTNPSKPVVISSDAPAAASQ